MSPAKDTKTEIIRTVRVRGRVLLVFMCVCESDEMGVLLWFLTFYYGQHCLAGPIPVRLGLK